MEKSTDAFRTISEVAEDLVLPQHVLRFWETKFPQIRPLKRAGGRRYYRPTDVVLLRSIRRLLYDEGYTIKGVQRLLKEQGGRAFRVDPTMPAPQATDEDGADDGPGRVEENSTPPLPVEPVEAVAPVETIARVEAPPDHGMLREALACVEECERILAALHRPIA